MVEAISGLDVERKVKLRQLLSDQIASELVHPNPVPYEQRKAALDALGKTVGRILEEIGMTEDELVEALAPESLPTKLTQSYLGTLGAKLTTLCYLQE